MALLWMEGFENFGTTINSVPLPSGIISRKYSNVGSEADMRVVSGRLGGYALKLLHDNNVWLSPSALTINSTMIVGFAIKINVWHTSNALFFALYDGATRGITLWTTPAGEILLARDTTPIATTSGVGISLNTWIYMELKVVCSDSGSYELRVDGDIKLSGSADTKAGSNNYHDTFRLTGTLSGLFDRVFDDVYCLDGSGSINNDFLGNRRVVTIRPNAAGDSTQFTPDSGDNYARVNEQVCDDDLSYVEDSITDEKDLYNYDSLPLDTAINGVMVNSDCRETDASSFSLKTLCKSSTTESADAGQAIGSTNYVTRKRILELDPHTSSVWTKSSLDAAQFGIQVG